MKIDPEVEAKLLWDAVNLGTGYARINMDGSVERLDPRDVQIAPSRCKVCDAPAGLACGRNECPNRR